ncbi:Alkaline phosphatase synthesis transcriptional regulatory protein PhoP [Clostridium perfringens NCTC 8239]|uniref:response regulator transcription factor n=1 Tax=Clostridium perfringens TaxID=1502 RepID=UPI0011DD0F3D|nr:response regulator transcription factor [Clostridium perfringens]MDH5061172.1 Alkaline phosphatase synthesis transcriptional regulatory protein PhoP [Clostridium perfringens NCTC 8239]CAG9338922.1 DNA-binding response regulator [Clostridium perfringens NCTC 8239]HAT4232259.1 response regulator transcription factor [Clostridium perfringens]HAT4241038.1 response regulator transcription factor [Clostridium perfringens]HAT4278459.1 response regulator transcription factor [Clostridium perfringen
MTNKKVLIVDDEEHIRELIKFNLKKEGYDIEVAINGVEALNIIREIKFDLILLDLMLPEIDGLEVCKEIRRNEETSDIPVMMITAKGEEFDKVLGLELGADDYITKPFSIRELMARVKALLRRSNFKKEENIIKFGDVVVNFKTREVIKGTQHVELTLKEFELLKLLIKNKDNILTRELLLDKIWGYEYIGETRTVDVHIRHLRKKIESDDKNPQYIQTIRGVGYKFTSNE